MELLLNWLDFLWIPFVLYFLRKEQKWKGVIFVLICMFALRLQVELLTETGYPTGYLPLLDSPVLYRGYLIWGIFITIFLGLGHLSRESNPFIYIAAGISVFTMAFIASIGVMCL